MPKPTAHTTIQSCISAVLAAVSVTAAGGLIESLDQDGVSGVGVLGADESIDQPGTM